MTNKQAYTIIQDDLLQIVGADGAVICAKVDTLCGENNEPCEISHEYFCKLLRMEERTLRRLLLRLKIMGYIEYQEGRGKGHYTTYKKGTNLLPFTIAKRGQKCSQKGTKMYPYKYKKNIINAHAHASGNDAAQRVSPREKATPLPIYRNGTSELANALHECERINAHLVQLRLNKEIVFCEQINKQCVIDAGGVVINENF